MPTLKTLRNIAAQATSKRGHRMRYIANGVGLLGTCKRCIAPVYITIQLGVWGPALTLNCTSLTKPTERFNHARYQS